jgi:hypothetical protein
VREEEMKNGIEIGTRIEMIVDITGIAIAKRKTMVTVINVLDMTRTMETIGGIDMGINHEIDRMNIDPRILRNQILRRTCQYQTKRKLRMSRQP